MYEYACKLCGAQMFGKEGQNRRIFCSKKCFGAFLRMKHDEKCEIQKEPVLGKLENVSDEGYAVLVAAIVQQARVDYLKQPLNSHNRLDAERFFLTTYEKLTGYDGREMLDRLDKEREKRNRRKKKEHDGDDFE